MGQDGYGVGLDCFCHSDPINDDDDNENSCLGWSENILLGNKDEVEQTEKSGHGAG